MIKNLVIGWLPVTKSFHLVFYSKMKKFSRKALEIIFCNVIDTGLSEEDFQFEGDEDELLSLLYCTLESMSDYLFHPD